MAKRLFKSLVRLIPYSYTHFYVTHKITRVSGTRSVTNTYLLLATDKKINLQVNTPILWLVTLNKWAVALYRPWGK